MGAVERDRLIERITKRLHLLGDGDLTSTATRIECLTEPICARSYGSAVARDQVADGELPTGWASDIPRPHDTLPSSPNSEDWESTP
jgi:hypothetical protein